MGAFAQLESVPAGVIVSDEVPAGTAGRRLVSCDTVDRSGSPFRGLFQRMREPAHDRTDRSRGAVARSSLMALTRWGNRMQPARVGPGFSWLQFAAPISACPVARRTVGAPARMSRACHRTAPCRPSFGETGTSPEHSTSAGTVCSSIAELLHVTILGSIAALVPPTDNYRNRECGHCCSGR
jgi:hypothetical protein